MADAENKEMLDAADIELANSVAKDLQEDESQCCPGAPKVCGPSFMVWNGGKQNCGFNPLCYIALFFVIGVVTLLADM